MRFGTGHGEWTAREALPRNERDLGSDGTARVMRWSKLGCGELTRHVASEGSDAGRGAWAVVVLFRAWRDPVRLTEVQRIGA